jgi:hypothetical protein
VALSQRISKRTENRISDLLFLFFDRHQHERASCNNDLAQSSYLRSCHARPLPPRPPTNYARSHPKQIPEASTRSSEILLGTCCCFVLSAGAGESDFPAETPSATL